MANTSEPIIETCSLKVSKRNKLKLDIVKNKTFNCVWFYVFSISLTYSLTEKKQWALYNPLKLEKIHA